MVADKTLIFLGEEVVAPWDMESVDIIKDEMVGAMRKVGGSIMRKEIASRNQLFVLNNIALSIFFRLISEEAQDEEAQLEPERIGKYISLISHAFMFAAYDLKLIEGTVQQVKYTKYNDDE